MKLRTAVALGALAAGFLAWGALRYTRTASASAGPAASPDTPVTRVRRGSVLITVSANGALQGTNAETLTAPTVAQDTLNVTFLRQPGELVDPGDVVAQFDTTQQEYNLKEAQYDLAEANENLAQTQATNEATDEENAYAVASAQTAVDVAQQDLRSRDVDAALTVRLHEIALEAAQNHLKQAKQDQVNQKKSSDASLAIQKANQARAQVSADLAKRNIENMTLKAKTGGYVSVAQNTFNQFVLTMGMTIPPIQIGDTVRPGMLMATIPDMNSWEVGAQISELDRGHLEVGQAVQVAVVALAGKSFSGRVKSLGNTSGQAWNRTFDCHISLDNASPELRPGMSSKLIITAGKLDNVLWVPSQALFEKDGHPFVYLSAANGFTARDVTLVDRSESQAALTGLKEGDVVALSNPSEQKKAAPQQQNAAKALGK
ncbi:MAG TPA: efflux RND transporter periplasmic adaptor subunit [Bryobacteraceae bacterium]|nr:efflux RND transporter periplasmic adaptor subunit [Bryobacteraceae bacterium]